MQKIASFLVGRHLVVLGLMTMVTVVGAFLTSRLHVTTEPITALPAASQAGQQVMAEEFPTPTKRTSIRVMGTGLDVSEARVLADRLRQIEHVISVDHDLASGEYTSGEHSLFVLHLDCEPASLDEAAVEETLDKDFTDDNIVWTPEQARAPGIPSAGVLTVAAALVLILLLAVSASWSEPVLVLLACASGTLITWGSGAVYKTMPPLGALIVVVQVALTVHHSITLLDRYHREENRNDQPSDAMGAALIATLPSVITTTLATLVALAVLWGMGVPLRIQLGAGLATAVVTSAITVFMVLVPLLLVTHKILAATAKTSWNPDAGRLADLQYRCRGLVAVALLVVTVGCCIMAGNSGMVHIEGPRDQVSSIFPKRNRVVLLHSSSDTAQASALVNQLAADPRVDQVTAVPTVTTIPQSAGQMATAMDTLVPGEGLDPDVLRLVYQDMFGEVPEMSAGEFITFVTSQAAGDPLIAKGAGAANAVRLRGLLPYADRAAMVAAVPSSALAERFGLDSARVEQMMLEHYAAKGGVDPGALTLREFIDFIVDHVSVDPSMSGTLDANTMEELRGLRRYTDARVLQTPISHGAMSSLLDVDQSRMLGVYARHQVDDGSYAQTTCSLPEIISFLRTINDQPWALGLMDDQQRSKVEAVARFTDTTAITVPMDAQALAETFSMDINQVSHLVTAATKGRSTTTSMKDFAAFVLGSAVVDPVLSVGLDPSAVARIRDASAAMTASIQETQLDVSTLTSLLQMPAEQVQLALALQAAEGESGFWSYTPSQLINYVATDPQRFVPLLGDKAVAMQQLSPFITGVIEGTRFTPSGMASRFGARVQQMNQIFLLRQLRTGTTQTWVMSPADFLIMVTDEVFADPGRAAQFDQAAVTSLKALRSLVDSVVSQARVSPTRMAELLGAMGMDTGVPAIQLIHLIHATRTAFDETWRVSMDELLMHIRTEVLDDPRFASLTTSDSRYRVRETLDKVDGARTTLTGMRFSRVVINTHLPVESDETTDFINDVEARSDTLAAEHYLVGQQVLAHQLADAFDGRWVSAMAVAGLCALAVMVIGCQSISGALVSLLSTYCGIWGSLALLAAGGDRVHLVEIPIIHAIVTVLVIAHGSVFVTRLRREAAVRGTQESLRAAHEDSFRAILVASAVLIGLAGIMGAAAGDVTTAVVCRGAALAAGMTLLVAVFATPCGLAVVNRWMAPRSPVGHPRRAATD